MAKRSAALVRAEKALASTRKRARDVRHNRINDLSNCYKMVLW